MIKRTVVQRKDSSQENHDILTFIRKKNRQCTMIKLFLYDIATELLTGSNQAVNDSENNNSENKQEELKRSDHDLLEDFSYKDIISQYARKPDNPFRKFFVKKV